MNQKRGSRTVGPTTPCGDRTLVDIGQERNGSGNTRAALRGCARGSILRPVSGLPLEVRAALVVAMVAAITWGFFGRPPESRDARAALLWGATAVLLGIVATQRLLTDEADGIAFLAGSVVATSLSVWHVRGPTEDEDGGLGVRAGEPGDGPGPGHPPGPPHDAVDWDAFDRARRGWERPRTNV